VSTYKVIQDIEAEDKLIGPFGIRQFIYLIIVAVSGFFMFKLFSVAWFLALPFLPHTVFFAMLALPFGGEQPTETWLLAKIRYFVKPKVRIWSQDGVQQLVTVTAPKKIEKPLTKNLSQGEVESRLKALANTIDSRGWAVKNVSLDVFQPAFAGAAAGGGSDRLIDIPAAASSGPPANFAPADDILDEQHNPTAQNLDRMIDASSKARREQLMESMKQGGPTLPAPQPNPANNQPRQQPAPQPGGQPPADYWFMNAPAGSSPSAAPGAYSHQFVTPDPNAPAQNQGLPLAPLAPASGPLTEDELLEKIHQNQQHAPSHGHMRVIKTLEEQEAEAKAAAEAAAREAAQKAAQTPVTPAPDPDILDLANNDDLNVETIARQANKRQQDKDDGEVVINLH
jgi:hypothetical protein